DDQLVPVGLEILAEDPPEVDLRTAIRRPVVVGEIEVRDSQVERATEDRAARHQRPVVAEVLPQPERDRGQLQSAAAAAPVEKLFVAVCNREVMGWSERG